MHDLAICTPVELELTCPSAGASNAYIDMVQCGSWLFPTAKMRLRDQFPTSLDLPDGQHKLHACLKSTQNDIEHLRCLLDVGELQVGAMSKLQMNSTTAAPAKKA